MANGQSLCFSRADLLPGGEGPPPPQLQEVSRGERGGRGRGAREHNTGPMINLPAGNLFLIETLRVFQPLARARSEDKDFEHRVGREGGRKWKKHSNDRINLFLPSFLLLSFFLSRFIDSFLWIQGRKINLELLIGEGGKVDSLSRFPSDRSTLYSRQYM